MRFCKKYEEKSLAIFKKFHPTGIFCKKGKKSIRQKYFAKKIHVTKFFAKRAKKSIWREYFAKALLCEEEVMPKKSFQQEYFAKKVFPLRWRGDAKTKSISILQSPRKVLVYFRTSPLPPPSVGMYSNILKMAQNSIEFLKRTKM